MIGKFKCIWLLGTSDSRQTWLHYNISNCWLGSTSSTCLFCVKLSCASSWNWICHKIAGNIYESFWVPSICRSLMVEPDLLFSDVHFWEILLNMCIIQKRYLLDCLHLFCVMVPIAQFARFVQGQCYQIIAILKKWSIVPQLIFLLSNFTLYKSAIFMILAVFESKFT